MSQRIQITLNNNGARLHGERGLAYAAGFFDGEGCVHIARQKHAGSRLGHVFRLVVSLSQNHLHTLVDFQNLTGVEGRIYQRPRQGTTNRDWYCLTYDGAAAETLLDLLQPFLLRKAAEALVGLQFQRDCHVKTHFGPKGCPPDIWSRREGLYRKLRNLK